MAHKHLLGILLLSVGMTSTISCVADDSTHASDAKIYADVWADNWFAMYAGDELIFEDSVKYQTERSFNAESFAMDITLPAKLSVIIKDFKENDTGLEYIGSRRQQIGDGGFKAQFFDAGDQLLAVSENTWRCITIHQAPLNTSCERDSDPSESCKARIGEEPENWRDPEFDDSEWPAAVVHSAQAVRPHGGYSDVNWRSEAKLIWTEDLQIDNTVLCRFTLDRAAD